MSENRAIWCWNVGGQGMFRTLTYKNKYINITYRTQEFSKLAKKRMKTLDKI